jgi:hypothetical protein
MSDLIKCEVCGDNFERYDLKKCPICHKMVCEECSFIVGGIYFCSKFCSEYFFFGDGDVDD